MAGRYPSGSDASGGDPRGRYYEPSGDRHAWTGSYRDRRGDHVPPEGIAWQHQNDPYGTQSYDRVSVLHYQVPTGSGTTDPAYPIMDNITNRMSHLGAVHQSPPLVPDSIDRSTFVSGRLDDSFALRTGQRAREFFVIGRVIACLWTEPAGEISSPEPDNNHHLSSIFLGGLAYTNVQRFVVICPRFEQHLSICCPIKTYGRRGTAKFKDKNAHYQHTIIYTSSDESVPCRLDRENEYNKEPIQMIPTDPTDHSTLLSERSRLNFGKPTPVEHNLRMKNIGMIRRDQIPLLLAYFDNENRTPQLPTRENLVHTTSRRRSSTNRPQASRAESIPEQDPEDFEDDGQDEDEENDMVSRPNAWQASNLSQTYYRDGAAYQLNTAPPHHQHAYGEDKSSRPRRDTTSSSPLPMRSRRLSAATSNHHRNRTLDPERNAPPYDDQGRSRSYR